MKGKRGALQCVRLIIKEGSSPVTVLRNDLPGGIKTGSTNDDIDLVLVALVVDKPSRSYMVDGVCETSGVLGNECLQISIARRWPAASDIEVFGYDFIRENGITIQFSTHLFLGILARCIGLLSALDDEFESLVQLVLDHLPVLE